MLGARSIRMARADAAILLATAAAAVALAIVADLERLHTRESGQYFIFPPMGFNRLLGDREPIGRALSAFWAMIDVFGVGVAIAAFRPRGAAWRRPWRGRGGITIATLAVCSLTWGVWLALRLGSTPVGYRAPIYFEWELAHKTRAGLVLGAWVASALLGRWGARPDWLDRAGRWIGWGWLVYPAYLCLGVALRD